MNKKTKSIIAKKKKLGISQIILCLVVLLIVIICFYPFLNVISYSLSGYNAVLSGSVSLLPKDITLNAYKEILSRDSIWNSMRVTVLATLYGTLLSLFLTVCAAYGLSRRDLPGRKYISGIILFTMYFGGGIIPTFLVVKSLGMYDTISALFVPQAVNVFNFIVMKTFFRQIPESLIEAAKIDGATDLSVLFRIVLPLSVPIIATIGLFYAVQYWNGYFDALIYTKSPQNFTLQLRLRSLLFADELNAGGGNQEGLGTQVMAQSLKMASVAVSTIPILVVYPWLQKYFVKGVTLGSVKG
ncbi:carbohydrate ABC transporter permease [Lacrimispora sp.]|uniref:carbohydrate ABC transporter permease n=1 Tax=Lacrimispora sp. TaxID=2719234 RepID=UPI00289DF34E|nr:carbohydrate ABC transporter permease [Lacrimispora sp.]